MDRLPLGRSCTKCGEWKLYEEFSNDKRRKDNCVPRCKVCVSTYHRARYQANREQILEANEQWRDKNADWVRDYKKDWYSKNKSRVTEVSRYWRQVNAELWRSYSQRWREANLEHSRMLERLRAHKRRARKRENGGSFTIEEWVAVCERYDGVCLCCGESKSLTIDHVIPLALGGENSIDNIQPLCGPCNIRKGAKVIDYRPSA